MATLPVALFDAIEVNAARTGNHRRAAARMSRLAEAANQPDADRPDADQPDAAQDQARLQDGARLRVSDQAGAGEASLSRAEAHLRAGEQWLLAGEPAEALVQFRAALALGGPVSADPRVQLARALFGTGAADEARSLIDALSVDGRDDPRTCDLVAELLVEQGDMEAALDWATAGVTACLRDTSPAGGGELGLLLRLRYRIRLDLGYPEDDYDRLLDDRGGPVSRLPDGPVPG